MTAKVVAYSRHEVKNDHSTSVFRAEILRHENGWFQGRILINDVPVYQGSKALCEANVKRWLNDKVKQINLTKAAKVRPLHYDVRKRNQTKGVIYENL